MAASSPGAVTPVLLAALVTGCATTAPSRPVPGEGACVARPPLTPPRAPAGFPNAGAPPAPARCLEGLARTPVFPSEPSPPTTGSPCGADGCWAWAGAGTSQPLLGAGGSFTVHDPRPSTGGHALAELAVAGAGPEREGIEVGWRVSPLLEGDARPHLFVHRWRSGRPCWTDCGFVPWSPRRAPGDALEPDRSSLELGIAVADGRWWIWVDGEWLGYFEAAAWEGRMDTAASAHWYGEVFAPGSPASGEMGNGRPGTEADAARVDRMCRVLPTTWTCVPGAVFPIASEPVRYPVRVHGDGLRYGGTAR